MRIQPLIDALRDLQLIEPDLHADQTPVPMLAPTVAIPPDRNSEPLRRFDSFTHDLERLADWLVQQRIATVAMETTGIYWIPVFEILKERGLEVILTNARDVKNLPGHETDVNDAKWLQRLNAYGLLRGSFRRSGTGQPALAGPSLRASALNSSNKRSTCRI